MSEAYTVEHPSLKHSGDICSTSYPDVVAAVTAARIKLDQGVFPMIRHPDFTARPLLDGTRVQWAMTFPPDGIWKSVACRKAEDAGVRYASHRRGYRASDRAFRRFCATLAEVAA